MLRRIAVVAAVCAATLPLFTGSASASCLDDFMVGPNSVDAGSDFDPSDHYFNWVHVEGTATVVVEGDDLISDAIELAEYHVYVASTSAAPATMSFVDCVAG